MAEFFDQVRLKPHERDAKHVLGELVQLAACAEMIAEDMLLIEGVPPDMSENDVWKNKYEELLNLLKEFRDTSHQGSIASLQRDRLHTLAERNPETFTNLVAKKEVLDKLAEILDNAN